MLKRLMIAASAAALCIASPVTSPIATAQTNASQPYSVRNLQFRLQQLGYFSGNPDGRAGPATRDAIRAYERDYGMPITGTPSASLYQRLVAGNAGNSSGMSTTAGISDSFNDGDYTKSPSWAVQSGQWQVVNGALRSQVAAPQTESQATNPKDIGKAMLRDLLSGSLGISAPGAAPPNAAISTEAPIDNAFHVQLRLSSQGNESHAMFGPYQSSTTDGYRIAYASATTGQPALQIIAVNGDQVRVIATATQVANLGDGAAHLIDWRRQSNGRMSVAVDGQQVLSTRDNGITGSFSGFAIANAGGDLSVDDLKVETLGPQNSRR